MKKNNKHIKNEKSIEKLILEQSSNYAVPKGKDKESVWEGLSGKLADKSNFSIKGGNNLRIMYKVAAASIIIILSSISYFYSDSKILTKNAETREVYLPDGSYVFLYAGSKITFNKNQWKSKREIKLKGEAFFSVKKGSTFTVNTENGNIQVLGTKFNVISRGKIFEVGCVSGKVRVNLINLKKSKILTQGEFTQKTASGKLTEPSFTNIEQIIKRQKGEFYFKQADLTRVFEEFERQFDVDIKYKELKNRKFTGYFSNNDIEKALKMVCKPMGLDYEINNKLIIIKNLAKSNQ